jgi:hypothetical protein
MSNAETPVVPRGFTKVDAKRAFISVAILAIVSVCYWFALPAVQSLIIPSAPSGRYGPWVLRPILAFHFGAVVVMAAVTLPLITWPLWRVWAREDAASGTRYDPFQGRRIKHALLIVKSLLLLVLYAAALLFYLFSWEFIGPDGIEERLPWTTLNHSYQDISSLETIPAGQRSESISKDGPWYSVKFKGGRSITLSDDNEGITFEELTAMTAFIADRSGLVWERRRDARPR